MKIQYCVFVMLLLTSLSYTQTIDSLANYYYKQGVTALNMKNYDDAKDLLKKSIDENESAKAEYQLAKVYRADTSHYSWNISRKHIKNAIKLDPNNPQYHLFYGLLAEDLFHYSWIEFDTIEDAIKQYKRTLELDSTNETAANRLGGIGAERFLEYNNSIQVDGNENPGSRTDLQTSLSTLIRQGRSLTRQIYENETMPQGITAFKKSAGDSFDMAESSYKIAIKNDSLNPAPYLKLASIYEDNNEPLKGIPYLLKLTRLLPANKEAHLELALLDYRTSLLDSAYFEYKKAIELMTEKEKKDFTYNSVKVLLQPYLKDKTDQLNENSLKQIINIFWKLRDPLNLTNYNERLLEHYTRVAYADLRFSVPKLGITGWKTDRGTVVIRYGIPPEVVRIRPNIVRKGLTKTEAKTEIWTYPDKTFSFTDQFRNGEYIYGVPGVSQYWDDTQKFAEDLKITQPEEYHPKYDGPVFFVPNTAAQFKDLISDKYTDLFINYGIKPDEKINKGKNYEYKHTAGIFLIDSYSNKLAENKIDIDSLYGNNEIEIPDSGNLFINTEDLVARPDSGTLSFEIIRDKDKGVSTTRGKFKIRSFSTSSLDMSDIVLASLVERGPEIAGRINRPIPSGKDYSILPNPTGIFSKDQDLYIYYEVYNLAQNEKGSTDFQQTIILKKKGEEGISVGKLVGSVMKFFGANDDEQQIGLTSQYQTKDKESQIYLQLDMSNYDPGNYILTVKIKDNISGKETQQQTELTWK